jgi:hypothetical protein
MLVESNTELTFTKFVTNHCDPPVLRRLSRECVASMLTHPLCWMPAHTETSCSLIGCREMMLESITLDKSGYDSNYKHSAGLFPPSTQLNQSQHFSRSFFHPQVITTKPKKHKLAKTGVTSLL